MNRPLLALTPAALLAALLFTHVERRSEPAGARTPVDAALVTAIDLSSSVMRHDEWLQFEGMARAVQHPEFLAGVARGRHGRVSFAVFGWSSHGRQRLLVPWMVIDGADSARVVATLLRQVPRLPRAGGGDDDEHSRTTQLVERRTDLSQAIRFGTSLLGALPRQGERRTLNLISNGADNVGGGPAAARDAAVDAGITINGVALGDDPGLAAYFRTRVIGGAGAFVMRVVEMRAFAEVVRAKFLRDLIAGPPPASAIGPLSS